MKKINLLVIMAFFVFLHQSKAQTQGTLTFSLTPTSHGTANHALAIWIANGSGGFGLMRTLNRYCDAATYNYLPNWASAASCGFQGTTLDATSSPCRIGGATVGGSLTTYSTINIVWDGLNNYGILQADGNYNVAIEETWGIGSSNTVIKQFSFVKGPLVDDQRTGIASDANFTVISLIWQPTLATTPFSVASAAVYPNPSKNGVFTLDFQDKINAIKVYTTLGALVYNETVLFENNTSKKLDLSHFANGIYIINLSNDKGATNHKVVIEK
jgi:hypothetical protein